MTRYPCCHGDRGVAMVPTDGYTPRLVNGFDSRECRATRPRETDMKVRNSLRSLKNRHRDCRVVRRKGRVYVINKTQRRFKARQG